MSTCCVLFAKNPEPGRVKTRLQPWCGPEGAAAVYRAFVLDCAANLASCRAGRKVVAYAPADAERAVRDLLAEIGEFELIPQSEAGLGERMARVMAWSFAEGMQCTAIIGSDSPSLPATYIDMALERLEERDAVLGPSTDGGYYLVGLRAGLGTRIFTGVEWSTGKVLAQTLERLGPLTLGLLPPWYDVDTPAEAGFLKVHLEALHRAGEKGGARSLEMLRWMEPPLLS